MVDPIPYYCSYMHAFMFAKCRKNSRFTINRYLQLNLSYGIEFKHAWWKQHMAFLSVVDRQDQSIVWSGSIVFIWSLDAKAHHFFATFNMNQHALALTKMPRLWDLVWTTTTQPITLPLAHVHRVIIMLKPHPIFRFKYLTFQLCMCTFYSRL